MAKLIEFHENIKQLPRRTTTGPQRISGHHTEAEGSIEATYVEET
jgi:hypothetical protein